MDSYLQDIIASISNSFGKNFFDNITLALDKVIKADYTFIALLDREAYESKTLALVAKGEIVDNFSYSLKDTPCADAADDSICCYPKEVCQAFPADQLLVDMNIEAYIGTPLHNSKGEVLGLTVALFEHEIEDSAFVTALFQLFSGRIAAEIERNQYEESLENLNKELENKVHERTSQLSSALETLNETKDQLVVAEKMSALASLVSGIAHEINTPLGTAITAQSVVSNKIDFIKEKFLNQNISTTDMQSFFDSTDEATLLATKNLKHAANLILNFKKIAVDQHCMDLKEISINKYYQMIISTLEPLLKTKNATLTFNPLSENQTIWTFPGAHSQIISHMISNSLQHGFSNHGPHNISISISKNDDDTSYSVSVHDNGVGLSDESKTKVFDPFYTETRTQGNSGIGMAIVYNLVTHKLGGNISVPEITQGTTFIYTFSSFVQPKPLNQHQNM